jgi:hypothetical protein
VTRPDKGERETPISVTYFVDRMRVIRPTGKTKDRNPDRVFTVNGVFYSTERDAKGNIIVKDKLSIITKNVDVDDAKSTEFALDVTNGYLTLPEGKRGRVAQAGLAEADILAELAALRGEDTDDTETETETETD